MSKRKRRQKAVAAVLPRRESGRRAICERARLATVAFGVLIPEENRLAIVGSGVVVDQEGTVITARHVVEGVQKSALDAQAKHPSASPKVFIPSPGLFQRGENNEPIVDISYGIVDPVAIAMHPTHDVAGLRIPPPNGKHFTYLPMSIEANLAEGDAVATCGFPYGTDLHEGKTVLSSFIFGSISAVVPHPVMPPEHRAQYLLQLPINPGNSGGAVFDPGTGHVIGITSRRYEPGGIPSGLAIAEPVHAALPLIAQLSADLAAKAVAK